MGSIRLDFSRKGPQPKQRSVKKYTYSDLGTKNFIQYKDGTIQTRNTTIYDKQAIKQSIRNILSFRTCQSILLPEFGIGDLYSLLYSTYDQYTVKKINQTVVSILNTWQPRISLISSPTKYDQNTIYIQINYIIPALNQKDTYDYLFRK